MHFLKQFGDSSNLSSDLKLNVKFKLQAAFVLTLLITLFSTSFNAWAINAEKPNTDNFAAALLSQHKVLSKRLADNQFNRPITLNSSESPEQLKGEIYAVLDYPFSKVNGALNQPAHWCDALILHINIKYCRAETSKSGTIMHLNLGKKHDQALSETYKAAFNYEQISNTDNYFSTELNAAEGPLGTSDYRIWIEATPLNSKQTFLHFTYAYSFGLTGRIAMKGYLATIGKDKVGFTVNDKVSNGQPEYIQGVRGVVERNTMRYYLTIDAYLAALNQPANKQLDKRLELWFNSTEQYAKQLHEVDRDDYVEMKRKEYQRQNAVN